jgi:uncharacterized protein (TIGR02996 family)
MLGFLSVLIGAMSVNSYAAEDGTSCGNLIAGYGPFDYRTTRGEKLDIVERYHFTPEVEALVRGKSSIQIGADINYMLGAFPNHHRALMSMVRLGEKLKTPKPPGANYSVECYFLRALRFQPDDVVARMMYANFLSENDRTPEAIRELEQVEKAAGDNPFTHYNLGLIYFDIKDYEKSLAQAHKAMALGFNRTALRDKLVEAGKWLAPEKPTIAPAQTDSKVTPPVN